jgi:hypothetical protein
MAETAAQRRALVRHRAGERCEYCHISAAADLVPFHLEHVVPHQHLGPTTSDNLALACSRCNCHQGPNLTGIDEATQAIVPLFNPRTQRWDDHFAVDAAGSVRRAEGENLTRRHRDTEKQDRADAATMRSLHHARIVAASALGTRCRATGRRTDGCCPTPKRPIFG